MEYRCIGSSDLVVSAVGVGGLAFGGWPMGGEQFRPVSDDEGIETIHTALDIGITCFDTAASYALGHAERMLGKALGTHRENIVVITKCGTSWNDATNSMERNGTYQHVIESAEASLYNLQTDYIDLLLVHWPDLSTPFEETMSALESLQKSGKIRYAGVSNFMPEMMQECRQYVDIIANEICYSIFDRRIEADVIPFCTSNEMSVISYGSLGHGLLSGQMTNKDSFVSSNWRASGHALGLPLFDQGKHFKQNILVQDQLRSIAESAGYSLPDVALAWVLQQDVVACSLVGFENPEQLSTAVAATDCGLTMDVMNDIESISTEAFQRMIVDEDLNPTSGHWNPWNRNPSAFSFGAID